MTLFNTSDPALRTGSAGEETASQVIVDIPDEGFDLVIMNPPFTRATNHEGAHADITNPAFAAFGATAADQTAMGKRVNERGEGTCYHGNAGVSSAFAALAHRKLRPGGVLALVLPLSVASGLSWMKFRKLLADEYTDLMVISIASDGSDISFSSETGMGECLTVGRKLQNGKPRSGRGRFTSLELRPQVFPESGSLALAIADKKGIRGAEDGPYGGTPLMIGDLAAGSMLDAPTNVDGAQWGSVRISDYSLAQTAHALASSKLQLPGSHEVAELPIVPLWNLGSMGLVDRDITGPAPRGPFSKGAATPTATYPSLWNHDARAETRIVCEPDSQLFARAGMEAKAAEVWSTATRVHLNRDYRFNSQALAVATTGTITLGGRAAKCQLRRSSVRLRFGNMG